MMAKMISLVLLKVYDDDPRYHVDDADFERVLPGNIKTTRFCDDHGNVEDMRISDHEESMKQF